MYPRVLINLGKFENNVKMISQRLSGLGIGVFGVSKVFCADERLATIFADANLDAVADSRIENLKKLQHLPIKKVLLRIPMQSQVKEVVKYADMSLNSEITTMQMLSREAVKQGKRHKVILMLDLGDLREGFFDMDEVLSAVQETESLVGIKIMGIGTNLTCYGAIVPKLSHMDKLVEIKNLIESKFHHTDLKYISAGNSSSYYLTEQYDLPEEINNLRIGEIFTCGVETAYRNKVKRTYQDVFQLETEIVELKTKPSLPIGEKGTDAFGNVPVYNDVGDMKRAICAIGRQDVNPDDIIPVDKNIEVIGVSSDHLILNLNKTENEYNVGDTIRFNLKYGGILSVMTSEYVEKVYIK